jgi:ABC-type xylose transport system permease subunit
MSGFWIAFIVSFVVTLGGGLYLAYNERELLGLYRRKNDDEK